MKHTAAGAYQNLIRPVIVRVSLVVSPYLDAEHAEDADAYVSTYRGHATTRTVHVRDSPSKDQSTDGIAERRGSK